MSQSAPVEHVGLDRTAGIAGALTYAMVGLLPALTDAMRAQRAVEARAGVACLEDRCPDVRATHSQWRDRAGLAPTSCTHGGMPSIHSRREGPVNQQVRRGARPAGKWRRRCSRLERLVGLSC